jgi:5-oxoprolinase (ATP-hydrolysing) subunit A
MSEYLVDLNCDMGESFGAFRMGEDEEVLPWVTSANIACGFHGGDPRVMERTVALAGHLGAGIGAHPGFPDLVGFGRRNLNLTPDEARTDTLYQIGALAAFTQAAGLPLRHVKPHGQLNNLAVLDRGLADAIVAGIHAFDPELILVAYGGELIRAGEERGMRIGYEVCADREYMPDGTLVPRSRPGAVIHDTDRIVRRTVDMVKARAVRAISGETVQLRVDTICIHGDTPGAAAIARAVHEGLEEAGIAVRPLMEVIERR